MVEGEGKGEWGWGGEGGGEGVLGASKGRCYLQEGHYWACQQQEAF